MVRGKHSGTTDSPDEGIRPKLSAAREDKNRSFLSARVGLRPEDAFLAEY